MKYSISTTTIHRIPINAKQKGKAFFTIHSLEKKLIGSKKEEIPRDLVYLCHDQPDSVLGGLTLIPHVQSVERLNIGCALILRK